MERRVSPPPAKPLVGLFVTCLVDLFRPTVGFAAASLIERAGCRVIVPEQTCCGQPAFNSGDRASARAIALATVAAFKDCDYVVAPSGSCAGMLAKQSTDRYASAREVVAAVDEVLGARADRA